MSILIKSGTLITAADTFQADVLIEGEMIASIGTDLKAPAAEVVDASGKLILPEEWTRTLISTYLCLGLYPPTITTPVTKLRPLGAPPPCLICSAGLFHPGRIGACLAGKGRSEGCH
jgi:hypothetical protein